MKKYDPPPIPDQDKRPLAALIVVAVVVGVIIEVLERWFFL